MRWWLGFVNADPGLVPDGPFGWKGIRWFQGWPHFKLAPLVHAFLVFEVKGIIVAPDTLGTEFFVYQTTEKLYERTTLEQRTAGTPCYFWKLPGDGSAAHDLCEKMVGKGLVYGYLEIAFFGPLLLLERAVNYPRLWLKKPYQPFGPIKNPWKTGISKFCSQASLDAMAASNVLTPWADRHAGVRPTHLWQWIETMPSKLTTTTGERITALK